MSLFDLQSVRLCAARDRDRPATLIRRRRLFATDGDKDRGSQIEKKRSRIRRHEQKEKGRGSTGKHGRGSKAQLQNCQLKEEFRFGNRIALSLSVCRQRVPL